jgi:predicted NAD/FAD-dependent oxidoreductase
MKDVCIIGAGLGGILLARALQGLDLAIVEKSKGIGGRVASRRLGGHSLNHGAMIEGKDDPHQWIKDLSIGLPIQKSWEVERIQKIDQGFRVTSLSGDEILSKRLALATPAPQAKKLLLSANLDSGFLENITYTDQIQFMALMRSPAPLLDYDLKFLKQIETPDGTYLHLYTLLSGWQKTEKEVIKQQLLARLKSDEIIEAHVHKWRYCEACSYIDPREQFRFFKDGLFLVGDYFGVGGVVAVQESIKRVSRGLSLM